MRNKTILIMIGVFLIAIVGADILYTITNAEIPASNPINQTRYSGEITFNCGKTPMSIYLNEPNLDIEDDFLKLSSEVCNEKITNVVDWNNRTLKQVDVDGNVIYSFDEDKLNSIIDSASALPTEENNNESNEGII